MPEERCIVTFHSTHLALRAERAAQDSNIAVRMIPVPRHISPDCNMGMEVPLEQMDSLKSVLAARRIDCNFVAYGDNSKKS